MTGGPPKRSVTIRGHRTSVSLEDEFWAALRDVAMARGMSLSALIVDVDAERGSRPLSSALRLVALAHFRARAGT